MRYLARPGRSLALLLGVMVSLVVTACPKRQDGLVFDEDPTLGDPSDKSTRKAEPAPDEGGKSSKSSKKSKGDDGAGDDGGSKKRGDSGSDSKKDSKKSSKSTGKKQMMYGRVVDRNDVPLKRVTILVSPGNTELISNKWGEFEIEGLHDENGARVELKRGQEYTINAWKPGYHDTSQIFRYEGEVQEIPTITLVEDSIKLDAQDNVPMIPTQTNDDTGVGAAGKSVENE